MYEGPGSPQFNLLHGIRISNDGLVYVADRVNSRLQVFRPGGHGGHGAGQFYHVHSIASDSKGNIYLGESFGARVLKWTFKG